LSTKQKVKLGEIFEVLDSDDDGLISPTQIDISGLNAEILQILMPLLQELETFNETLDKEEFIESGLVLYQVSPLI